jgi:hypothetical protein
MNAAKEIREAIAAAINADKSGYNLNPNVVETHIPDDNTEGAVPLTCYLVVLDADEERETRTRRQIEQPVMIGVVQAPIKASDIDTIDDLIELVQSIKTTLSQLAIQLSDNTIVTWTSNVAEKDETGLPFSYVKMREISTFESYFTATYSRVN